jgi:hypothetical protein
MIILLRYNDALIEQAGFQTIKAGQEKMRLHLDRMDN